MPHTSRRRYFNLECFSLLILFQSVLLVSAQRVNPCAEMPCQNGGTCTAQGSFSFNCSCSPEFTGIICESSTASSDNTTSNTTVIGVPTISSLPQCQTEVAASIKWRSALALPNGFGQFVARSPCPSVHPILRGGVVERTCTAGVWSDIDFSACTMREDISNSFLLLWLNLDTNNKTLINTQSTAILTQISQHLNLNSSNSETFLSTVKTSGSSAGLTVLVQYSIPSPPSTDVATGLEASLRSLPQLESLGGISVDAAGASGFNGFYKTDSCSCQSTDDLFQGLCEDVDIPFGPCICTANNCSCKGPYFVGNGVICTIDSDGDRFPDVPLSKCDSTTASLPYCNQDTCPEIYNPDQNTLACMAPVDFVGCPSRVVEQWDIVWANTFVGSTDRQRCPNGPGFATRFCGSNGWKAPVLTECESFNFQSVRESVDSIFEARERPLSDRLGDITEFSQEILSLTAPSGAQFSLLPVDLNTTNRLLDGVVELLEETLDTDENITEIPDQGLLDIMSNVLQGTNLQGWVDLQQVDAGSQKLLDNVERYALYLANTLNDEDDQTRTVWQRENIVIGFRRSDPSTTQEVNFPESMEDISEYYESIPAQITLPNTLFRARRKDSKRTVPVTSIIFRNMQAALPTGENSTMSVVSMVLSTQVTSRGGAIPELENDPVKLMFNIDKVENATEYRCAYWKFSDPIGSGGWAFDGITMVTNTTTDDGKVVINCTSTHLTSFAVLVDVSGTQGDTGNTTAPELIALRIVSYIGCAISIACLLVTIVFFITMGRELFVKVHYFIHLNLAISLCLAYIAFVAGVEPAAANREACIFVSTLLHYLFLSSFCWMLCEGIMLYLMLVVVFSKLAKRWWAFLLIGYGIPVVPVAVSVGIRHNDYGVEDSDGNLVYCWLSTSKGVIWAFVGPMLLIIFINIIFMIIALVTLFRTTRRRLRWRNKKFNVSKEKPSATADQKIELFRTLFIASLVLLPILGLTWVLGLFAVNSNTTVFAWLFTIVNSLQGVFIFFFHVIRSDKIWKSKRALSFRSSASSTFRTTFRSSTITSNGSSVAGSSTIKKKFNSYASESFASDSNKIALSSIAEESFTEKESYAATSFHQTDSSMANNGKTEVNDSVTDNNSVTNI